MYVVAHVKFAREGKGVTFGHLDIAAEVPQGVVAHNDTGDARDVGEAIVRWFLEPWPITPSFSGGLFAGVAKDCVWLVRVEDDAIVHATPFLADWAAASGREHRATTTVLTWPTRA